LSRACDISKQVKVIKKNETRSNTYQWYKELPFWRSTRLPTLTKTVDLWPWPANRDNIKNTWLNFLESHHRKNESRTWSLSLDVSCHLGSTFNLRDQLVGLSKSLGCTRRHVYRAWVARNSGIPCFADANAIK
jgi:hypothetical protein